MQNKKLIYWSITAALAGFLFGFDTVVISGAEQKIQALWILTPAFHGIAISMAIWGTVIGAMVGGLPAEYLGRKKTLLLVGILYLLSAVWSGLAPEVISFMVARFIGGVGVGISTVAAPMYIAEISPAKSRGRLTGMFQFNIVFGILVAFSSNSLLSGTGSNDWRWMLGAEAVPALIYTLLVIGIPESPRWLIAHAGRIDEGIAIFRRIRPDLSEEQIKVKSEEIASQVRSKNQASRFFTLRLIKPIQMAFLIALFSQLSGINAILYFAPRIFELSGLGIKDALLQSVGIGLTNLVFTLVGLFLIDRLGRRTLLLIGSIGYILSLGLCSIAFFTHTYVIVPLCIFAFIAAHAIGMGAVIWVFIGEIFPNRNRAAGQTLGSFTHWISAALITLLFPKVASVFEPGYIFAFFSFMMVMALLWIKFFVPETKGRSLEQIEKELG